VKPAASTTGRTPPEANATSCPAATAARAIGASGSKWPRPPTNVNRTRTARHYRAAGTVNPLVNDPFKALAHPIRRGIVERLAHGPATVGSATAGFGVSKPAISKHLKVLEESGVVVRVIDGRTHRLSLQTAGLGEAADWMDRQRARWERLFDVVDDYLKEDAQ
jgi:DNA-binding transcriptional ArsR family regulator